MGLDSEARGELRDVVGKLVSLAVGALYGLVRDRIAARRERRRRRNAAAAAHPHSDGAPQKPAHGPQN